MARLGFVDTEGNVFNLNSSSSKKKKKQVQTQAQVPAMAAVAQTVKPTIGDTAKYYGKSLITGFGEGIVQSPNAELQEMELAAKKGKKINTVGEAAKQVLNSLSTISNINNPLNANNLANYAAKNIKDAKEITKVTKKDLKGLADVAGKAAATVTTLSDLKNPLNVKASINNIKALQQSLDKNKTNKALGLTNSAVSNTIDMLGLSGNKLADATYSLVGAVDKNADKKIRKAIDTINEPIYKSQDALQKESERYGNLTNQIASGLQSMGNMGASLIGSAVTKNPDVGMAIMANAVKGQATEDARRRIAYDAGEKAIEKALKQGKTQEEAMQIGNAITEETLNSEDTLERARQIGNTRAAAEWATESLSGLGLSKVFGKGVTDDVAKNIIDNYIKNPTANFLATKAAAPVSEIGEEMLSEVLNTAIDRGTIDPDAKVTKEKLLNTIIPTFVSTVGLGGITGDYSRRAYQQNALQLQQAQNQMNPVQKVQSLNEVQRNALIEVTNKRKQGIPLDQNDYAVIGAINNTVNNMVDAQRGQNFGENLQLQNTINPTTLQESANQYGYKGDAEQLANIQTMLDNRGIQSRFDASMFNDNDTNALWMVDENGNRQVVFNPNANENDIMEEVAVHELAHDIMASENSNIALKPEDVLNFVQTLEGYEQARADLENTYSQVYDKNSPEFKSLIDEEVVADFLGKRLGNQEYVTQLTNSNPNFARKIYNWVVDKLNSIVNSGGNVRSERLYWQNIKNNFEKAYNMEYQNNKANVKYKFESISPYVANEYKNATNKQLNNKEFAKLSTIVESSDVKRGINKINNIYDENTNTYKDYTIYKKAKGEFKVLDSIDSNVYNGTEGDNNGRNGYRVKESRSSDGLDRVGIEENNNQETRTSNDAILRNNEGQNRKFEQIDFEDNRNKRNGKELDNSSFYMDNKGRTLTKEQQKYFKDSKVRDENGNLMEVYHGTNQDFNIFESNKIGDNTHNEGMFGKGHYFTNNYDLAEGYSKYREGNQQVKKGYLNLTNPFMWNNIKTEEQMNQFIEDNNIPEGVLKWNRYEQQIHAITENENSRAFTKALQENGYDGVIYEYRAQDENHMPVQEIVSFESNQFKNIDNTNPTQNPDIRYSVSKNAAKDNQGRQLSQNQQEYFKDSKIRDKDGNLKVMYHGTEGDFNVFDMKQFGGKNGTAEGFGIYLADTPVVSDDYGNRIIEAYVNVKKPATTTEITTTPKDIENCIKELVKKDAQQMVDDGDYDNINDALKDTWISNYTYTYDKSIEQSYKEVAQMIYDSSDSDYQVIQELMNGSGNNDYQLADSFYDTITDTLGFDGIQTQWDFKDNDLQKKNANILIAFRSNQVKNVDNLNPTTNDDIRKSVGSEGWEDFLDRNVKSEGTKTRLKDLKVPKETKTTQSKAKISGSDEISAKKDESVITVRNNKGQELKLKQDKTNPNIYEKEVKVPKDNKSIVPKETMQKQLAKLKDGTKVSNFYSNLTENSKFITQENANKLSQEEIWRYAPQTNKETMANAEARIGDTQKSLETAYGDFLSKGENFSPEDVGVGWILLKRFQDAGNYDAMVQVAKKMRNIATKSGQTVQMFNLQSRLTPEGMVKYAQSELMEAEQQFNKGKSQKEIDKYAKDFELTGEEVEFIKNQMEKIQGMEDGRAKNIEMAKINKMLSDKLPHQRGDSIKAWMRMSMLFNPKTQVRNVVGNALITPINALADVPASIADKAISKKTGTRTIGAPSLSGLATYGKGFARGGVEAWQDYRMGLDTKDVDMSRFDITQKNPFVTDHKGAARVLNPVSKGLNQANSFLDLVMSGGDRVFYQGAFDASLRNQMELNNVKTPTQDMIDIATQEALSRTWNDNNGYTQFVLNTRRALNKASIGGYGLGDVLIPFAKTPANLTKAIYDYSPVGLTTTLFKTKSINNAIETGQITAQMQHDFAQNLGKGVAGTMLYAMAYALAKAGIATGSSDDDKDVANFIKNTMGIQPYSIKIGDKSFTYDWAQPVAAPIAIASDAYQNLTRDSDEDTATRIFNTILDVSNTGFNVLMQQSFLQGISEVLNSNEGVANGIIEQVIGLPARAVPTFVQQINNMFDKTQRVAFEKNQPLKTGKQNVISKLPGQSQRLAPRVDALGNEVQRYGDSESDLTYALKNFLSPANQSNRKTSKAASEIYEVYEATGDKTIMPMVAPYYIQNKTVGRIDLDSKDRATYQKISGKLINDAVVELTNDADYNKLSYDEKAEVLNGVVSYANAKAKEHFTGFMANTYNPANKKINNGMSIADYYLEKTMNKR